MTKSVKSWFCIAGIGLLLGSNLAVASETWKFLGEQGVMKLVAIDEADINNEDVYRSAISVLCRVDDICQVLFWIDDSDNPTGLPMSDQQAELQIAHWQCNSNTGLRSMLWSCKRFPETPKDECF